jgi:oxygen-independent coproporphyrinogen-3 oxidase
VPTSVPRSPSSWTCWPAAAADRDGCLAPDGDGFRLIARGRPFVRSIAARFDAWLGRSEARQALAV